MELIRDQAGRLRCIRGTCESLLADFLETDVREGREHVSDLLSRVERIVAGEAGPEEFYGNVYETTVSADGVTIANMHDDTVPPLHLPVQTLAAALRDWRDAQDRER
jgi:hypothetical protein